MRKLQVLRGLIAAAITFLPASALAQTIQLSTVVSGLSSPGVRRECRRRHRTASSSSSKPESSRFCSPAPATPTRVSRHPQRRCFRRRRAWAARPGVPSAVREQRPILRVLHALGRRRPGDRRYPASPLNPNVADTTETVLLTIPHSDQRQPQRRHARVRPGRLPLHRRG